MVISIIMNFKNIHFYGNNFANNKKFNWNNGIGFDNYAKSKVTLFNMINNIITPLTIMFLIRYLFIKIMKK